MSVSSETRKALEKNHSAMKHVSWSMEVKETKYLMSIDTPPGIASALTEKPDEMMRTMKELLEQLKPEAAYFSTTRRFSIFIVNVEDPHVELRKIYETLSKFGQVTVDPVSTTEEFHRFWESL